LIILGNKVNEIPVADVAPEKILDTSCAGDAFVGGFLAQYLKNESIEKCIDCGNWAAGLIIQRHGNIYLKF
jgi:sugar/nucleoside kinase (ribokinase family)